MYSRRASAGDAGPGQCSKYVRWWSNLIQNIAFVKVRSMDLPKSMRIFVH